MFSLLHKSTQPILSILSQAIRLLDSFRPALLVVGGFVMWYWLTAGRLMELLRRVVKVLLAVLALGVLAVAVALAVLALPYLLALLLRRVAIRAAVRRNAPRIPDCSLLTVKRLAVYNQYHGSMDFFLRQGGADEQALLSDEQWALIKRYLDDLRRMQQGLLSAACAERLEADLFRDCATVTTVIQLRRMSRVNYGLEGSGLLDRILLWLFPLKPSE
ncbi:hypothetical protein [Hymenobacter persicinus]|uniref:Uncharacterized protein n=1 Tax=Hymenobacter persicinus TaxID=2025506 RepID=A0A4Q5LA00_9BACT|nr:hypothetical protein [Hymenobacter persicinus]RYU77678.1 hypothetical protein EWM57_17285 [Hymenobacter persicinus]